MKQMVSTFGNLCHEDQKLGGGKGGTLARLYQAGYPVPDGIVILPAAFEGDTLRAEAWQQVTTHLERIRRANSSPTAFAVRSSALSEDSVAASFAGEFETVLDIQSNEVIHESIHLVHQSRHSERVRAYSEAQNIQANHEMAVVIQNLVQADISGILFTADPVTGSHTSMSGNFIHGLGEGLVSGEVEPFTFTIQRPKGRYAGPPELGRFAHKLFRLATQLERELGRPQDIEWAIAKGKLYLLQSRPITTLVAANAATGEWNDSLTGDYLWSRNNFGEARPDVMTPFTWSLTDQFWREVSLIPGYSYAGNIAGRFYANISVMTSMICAMGKDLPTALAQIEGLLGQAPEGLDVPLIPFPKSTMLSVIPKMLQLARNEKKGLKKVPAYLANNATWCSEMKNKIRQAQSGEQLIALWQDEITPYFKTSFWILAGGTKPYETSMKLRGELIELVGQADTNALLSNLSDTADHLASLGPAVGIAKVARGEMSRQDYLQRYGHRGPHEAELSYPRPAEDPAWLDQQLAEYNQAPIDIDALLARRRSAFEVAWQRLEERYPRKAKAIKKRLDQVPQAARLRETVRSESTRSIWVNRAFALRAGELTGLDERIFFLSIDEVLALLAGDQSVVQTIPARQETHARYCALPALPMLIRGRFDPFAWAQDPERRRDIFDAQTSIPLETSNTITGFSGAAGRVEGLVRVLDSPEEGDQFLQGEVLVAVSTNVGWTPLFPRATAIVTDVGAPLSHAAIVARELGIPAVVGCSTATSRLKTGDRVRVDGGRGVIEILKAY